MQVFQKIICYQCRKPVSYPYYVEKKLHPKIKTDSTAIDIIYVMHVIEKLDL